MSLRSREDRSQLFEMIASLPSFHQKKSCVKPGRWFSWHNACEDHYNEFWSSRMLLSSAFPVDKSPDVNQSNTFAELRKGDVGGLKLALQCCSWRTWFAVTAMKMADQPLWQYYSQSVKNCKTPEDGLTRLMNELAGDKWMSNCQFTGLVQVFFQESEFERVRIYHQLSTKHLGDCTLDSSFTSMLHFYVMSLLNTRARSLAKYNSPPECYAGLCGEDRETRATALELLKSDWRSLRLLEMSEGRWPQELAADLRDSVSKPMRLCVQLYETNQLSEASSLLSALLKVLPDTKLIEDIHQVLRTEAEANANQKLRPREIFSLVQTSSALESRKIKHPAALDKESFMSRWATTSSHYSASAVFNSGSEKLPKFFSGILSNKRTWRALSEEAISTSAAAWHWIRLFVKHGMASKGFTIKETSTCFR